MQVPDSMPTTTPPPTGETPSSNDSKGKLSLKKILPLLVLVAGGAYLWFGLGVGQYLSFEALSENRHWLTTQVNELGFAAALIFIVLYALATAFSIPGGLILTLLGGFLFGTFKGTLLVTLGATLGSLAVFMAARTALADVLRAKVGKTLERMEDGFKENALSYMLVLRLVPLFPFWLVNLVPAFLGVSTRTYFIGTLLGIIPGTFVYASVGNGLGAIFDAGQMPDAGIIFQPNILGPILGLAILSLIPIFYKKYKARRSS